VAEIAEEGANADTGLEEDEAELATAAVDVDDLAGAASDAAVVATGPLDAVSAIFCLCLS
jgi:hypothetical protein